MAPDHLGRERRPQVTERSDPARADAADGHRYFEHSSGLGDAPAVMGVLLQQVADRVLRCLKVFEAGHFNDLAGLGEIRQRRYAA